MDMSFRRCLGPRHGEGTHLGRATLHKDPRARLERGTRRRHIVDEYDRTTHDPSVQHG